MKKEYIDGLTQIAGSDNVLTEEPMKKHTTFRIGGPAEVLVSPTSINQIQMIVRYCNDNNIPWIAIGNGSNLLVSDNGIRGVVIRLLDNFAGVEIKDNIVRAQAGAYLSVIGNKALDNSLTGFEFASGIPGTLGGACFMNAGAYGGEMKDILLGVTAMDEQGNIHDFKSHELELSYRNSIFARRKMIVLEAVMELEPGNKDEIKACMLDLASRRREKQPLEFPSAGSTFKRPEGYFAGKLIMDAGLRGYTVGGAAVSEKHCGFVINTGTATAADVMKLIQEVSDKVYAINGVRLEPEVRVIGEK